MWNFGSCWLGIALEIFDSVDRDFPVGKALAMIDPFMAGAAYIASPLPTEPIRIDQAFLFGFLKGLVRREPVSEHPKPL